MRRLTLKQARDLKGWSQEQLELETKRVDPDGRGVDQQNISKIERGTIADPRQSTVEKLELALGVKRGTLAFGYPESQALAS